MPDYRILRRAFTSNLRSVSASDGERSRLEAFGIRELGVQRYLAWRRGMVAAVLVFTLLSAGLATFLTLTESDDEGPFSAIAERILEDAKHSLPEAGRTDEADELATMAELLLQDEKETTPSKRAPGAASEDDEEEDDEHPGTAAEAVKNAKAALSAASEDGAISKAIHAGKAAVQDALAAAPDAAEKPETVDRRPQKAFGRLLDAILLLSFYAIPLASAAALFWWAQPRRSFCTLAVGWAFAFFAPMLLAFCPWSWWGEGEPPVTSGQRDLNYYVQLAAGFREGMQYLISLLPTVLSLIPGVQRACLRVKTLLPESMLPGWFLVAAAPLNALFLLVFCVAINQVASVPLFLAGMFLFLAAPLVYVVRADVFTRPLTSDGEFARMRRLQSLVSGLTLVAVAMMAYFLLTREAFGVRLVGLDEKTSVFRPLDLVDYVLEFVGRLMFMTVLGADLFVRMNVTAWKHSRAFEGSPEARDYHRVMEAMERAVA